MIFRHSLVLLLVALYTQVQAQPFADEINAFKKQDSMHYPAKHSIVFVGSSSFRKWVKMKEAFPNYPVINRGFGGSTLPDVIRYVKDIVIAYQPRQVIVYCGDNDLASSDTVTAAIVLQRFTTLFGMIRKALPYAEIDFLSIKPSPSRWNLAPAMVQANDLVKAYLKKQQHARFIDVYHPMLDANGKVREDLFTEDRLHMNDKGYAIWQKIIQPYLLK